MHSRHHSINQQLAGQASLQVFPLFLRLEFHLLWQPRAPPRMQLCLSPPLLMPPQLITEATTIQGATAAAKAAATAQAHVLHSGIAKSSGPKVGPTVIPMPKVLGPSVMQLQAAASKAVGSAPKHVHEAGPLGSHQKVPRQAQVKAGPHIDMLEEFRSADSMQEPHHAQQQEYAPQESMQVLPAAWRHHVPVGHEMPFAAGPQQQDAEGPHALNRAPPRPEEARRAAPLAEYHLASPAAEGSTILQLVSQSGLQVGDHLLIAPGPLQQELVQVVSFGSVIIGVPLRHSHAAGTPITLAVPYQTGTPAQAAFMRGEAARHAPPRRQVPSQGGMTDDDDAASLDGFQDDQAWSDAEREHQKARRRRKNRQALRPTVRALPNPPVVSHTIRQPEKFHCPPCPKTGG